MTENSIKEYETTMEMLEAMIESANDLERDNLVNALYYVKNAGIDMASEKREAADVLLESGELDQEDYQAYVSYADDFIYAQESAVSPYMEIAAIGAALTMASAENIALHSNTYNDVIALENGDDLTAKQQKFLRKRIENIDYLVEGVDDDAYLEDVNAGTMTEDLRTFLTLAQESWSESRVRAEAEAKQYIMESIDETGSIEDVQQCISEAVEEGEITQFVAGQLNKIIDVCDVASGII